MKRIYSIDLFKLVFAYIIAFFHYGTTISPGPTAAVQIFFLISGFFLARKYYARSHGREGYDQWDYTLDHIKSLYPHYLLSLVMLFGYNLARALVYLVKDPSWEALADIFLRLYELIPELTLLHTSHTWYDPLNYPLWQISALLIAGYFVYGLLCHNEKLSRKLLFPAAILMILSLLSTGVDIWGNYGLFFIPLLRAFGPMCIGVLAYYFTTLPYYKALVKHRLAFNLAVLYALVSIFVYAEYRNIFLVTTVILLWGFWEKSSWINRLFNHRIFRFSGELSLAVYMNHALVSRFLLARVYIPLENSGTPAPLWQKNTVYFLLLTACSVVTMTMVAKWKKWRRQKAVL